MNEYEKLTQDDHTKESTNKSRICENKNINEKH